MKKTTLYILILCSLTRIAGAGLWSDLAAFKEGNDVDSPPAKVNALIVKTPPGERGAIEDKLIALLNNPDATDEAKWFCCRMLRRIGTEKCVPALAGLLENKTLSDYARLALERLADSDAAGQALMDALAKAPDQLKPGIMGSLAARGEKKAVKAITKFVDSDNPAVAKAATQALAQINPVITDTRQGLKSLGKTEDDLAPALLRLDMESEDSRNEIVATLPQLPPREQQVILGAIVDFKLLQYEKDVLALLSDTESDLNNSVIYTLGIIGGKDSFKPLYELYQKRPGDEVLTRAISQLAAPSVDEYLLKIVRTNDDPKETLGAITPLVLRNPDGAADALNVLAGPDQPDVLRKAAYKSLETIGNTDSGKVFVKAIMQHDAWTRPAQLSLKRMSVYMEEPQRMWKKVFQPALKSAPDNTSREALLAILDGVPCKASLKYLEKILAEPANPLRAAALRSLSRWPEFDAGEVWINVLKSDQITEEEVDIARRGIVRLLSVDKIRKGFAHSFQLATAAIQQGPTATFKQSILASLKIPQKKDLKKVRKFIEPLLDDPDVGEQVREILKSTSNPKKKRKK